MPFFRPNARHSEIARLLNFLSILGPFLLSWFQKPRDERNRKGAGIGHHDMSNSTSLVAPTWKPHEFLREIKPLSQKSTLAKIRNQLNFSNRNSDMGSTWIFLMLFNFPNQTSFKKTANILNDEILLNRRYRLLTLTATSNVSHQHYGIRTDKVLLTNSPDW
jgi:hypothetical protein